MREFIKKHLYPLLIAGIVLLIAIINYTPGVFISGWDTLHPEFDFNLNFQRLFNGVWRVEQGLGTVSGHSAMAELPRVVILWILHFVFPLMALKYLYLIICLLLGPLGIYYLISNLQKDAKSKNHFRLIAFLSGLFYLFNLGTVQQFYLPFEMFPTQYAYLPWILLFSVQYLQSKKPKYLLYFAIVTLLATPQAYAAQLWYAFFGVYLIFLVCYSLFNGKQAIKKAFILILLTLAINSFWLLPNFYYIATSSSVPKEAKQNRIYSQEYLLRNREHGYLKDVALARGFYFKWSIYDFDVENFASALGPWPQHVYQVPVLLLGYSFFILSLGGILISIKRKSRVYLPLLPFVIVPFVMLMNHTFPFDAFFDLLLRVSILEEALRFVYTKFSILLIFGYAIYFSQGVVMLLEFFKKRQRLVAIIVACALVLYCLPYFQGQLISPKLKVKIPASYFDFWHFMKSEDQGVVLSLPLNNFSGWQYYNWGYQGSGFLWFGLKQSLLDRDSDRWSIANEQTFREFHYSLYARNPDYFRSSLEKYNVRYIVWDKSVTTPLEKNTSQIVFSRETKDLLDMLIQKSVIKKLKTFGSVEVYEVQKKKAISNIIQVKNSVGPSYRWSPFDTGYFLYGNYITDDSNKQNLSQLFFPFRDIITVTDRAKKDIFEIDHQSNSYFLQAKAPQKATSLYIPDYIHTEEAVYANMYVKQTGKTYALVFDPLLPKGLTEETSYALPTPLIGTQQAVNFSLNGTQFSFDKSTLTPQLNLYLGQALLNMKTQNYLDNSPIPLSFVSSKSLQNTNILFSKFPLKQILLNADQIYKKNKKEKIELKQAPQGNYLSFKAHDSQVGVYIDLSSLPHNLGYVVITNSQNIEGMPLRICFENLYSKICSFYDELSKSNDFTEDYFFIPPEDNGIGYGLSLNNISYGDYGAENNLKSVTVLALPYTFLSQLNFVTNTNTKNESTVYLYNQAFNPGWKAYENGKELKDHVLVNNWANGWILDNSVNEHSKISVVFWPQYLEYSGLCLLFVSLTFLGWRLIKNKKITEAN